MPLKPAPSCLLYVLLSLSLPWFGIRMRVNARWAMVVVATDKGIFSRWPVELDRRGDGNGPFPDAGPASGWQWGRRAKTRRFGNPLKTSIHPAPRRAGGATRRGSSEGWEWGGCWEQASIATQPSRKSCEMRPKKKADFVGATVRLGKGERSYFLYPSVLHCSSILQRQVFNAFIREFGNHFSQLPLPQK
jgi:hypothetical protein